MRKNIFKCQADSNDELTINPSVMYAGGSFIQINGESVSLTRKQTLRLLRRLTEAANGGTFNG